MRLDSYGKCWPTSLNHITAGSALFSLNNCNMHALSFLILAVLQCLLLSSLKSDFWTTTLYSILLPKKPTNQTTLLPISQTVHEVSSILCNSLIAKELLTFAGFLRSLICKLLETHARFKKQGQTMYQMYKITEWVKHYSFYTVIGARQLDRNASDHVLWSIKLFITY